MKDAEKTPKVPAEGPREKPPEKPPEKPLNRKFLEGVQPAPARQSPPKPSKNH